MYLGQMGLTSAQLAAKRKVKTAATITYVQPMPANGVLTTGSAGGDFPLLRSGKTVYAYYLKNMGTSRHPSYRKLLRDVWGGIYLYPTPAQTWDEFNQRVYEASKSGSDLFSRDHALKAARVAAVVAAVYFAAPYVASAGSSAAGGSAGAAAGGSAGAAAGGAVTAASGGGYASIVAAAEEKLKQKARDYAQQKLMEKFGPKPPAPSQALMPPGSEPIPAAEAAPEPAPIPPVAKAATLTAAALLPLLLLL